MTQKGKCDVCRKRKIKCDDARPRCTPCEKSSRECMYDSIRRPNVVAFIACDPKQQASRRKGRTTAETPSTSTCRSHNLIGFSEHSSNDETVALRSTKNAKAEDGMFAVLRSLTANETSYGQPTTVKPGPQEVKSPNKGLFTLFRQPTERNATMVARWVSVADLISPGDPLPCILGEWQEDILPRLGHTQALDMSIDCFTQCVIYQVNRTDENLGKAVKLNSAALFAVRDAVGVSGSIHTKENVLLAISFLYVVEAFMGLATSNHKTHLRGRNELLVSLVKKGYSQNETCRKMFYASAWSDMVPAIFRGEKSIFDQEIFIRMPCPPIRSPPHLSSEQYEWVTRRRVRLPRLVGLLRRARESPTSSKARNAALEEAAELYLDDLDSWVHECATHNLFWNVPTTCPDYSLLVPESFQFKSAHVFQRLHVYWHMRAHICGCVRILGNLLPVVNTSIKLDPAVAEAQELDAVDKIVRCIQYAMRSSSPSPTLTISFLSPIQQAFRSYGQWEMRAATEATRFEASAMKELAYGVIRDILKRWNGEPYSRTYYERMNDVMTGGPLPPRNTVWKD